MSSGDTIGGFDDPRLMYIYNVLVKNYKFKKDTWVTMMETASFNVSTSTQRCVSTIILLIKKKNTYIIICK